MQRIAKKRHNLLAFRQGIVFGKQVPKILEFLPAAIRVPRQRDERLHVFTTGLCEAAAKASSLSLGAKSSMTNAPSAWTEKKTTQSAIQ